MRQKIWLEFWLWTLLFSFFGCAPTQKEPSLSPDLPKVELAEPVNGVQFEGQGIWIQPGESAIYCEIFRLDGSIEDGKTIAAWHLVRARFGDRLGEGGIRP